MMKNLTAALLAILVSSLVHADAPRVFSDNILMDYISAPGVEWFVGAKTVSSYDRDVATIRRTPLWSDTDQLPLLFDGDWRFASAGAFYDGEAGAKIVIAGDFGKSGLKEAGSMLAVFDYDTQKWSTFGRGTPCSVKENLPRGEDLSILPDGRLLVVGTFGSVDGQPAHGAAIFDPVEQLWSVPELAENQSQQLWFHTSAVIGKRIFLGGPCGVWVLEGNSLRKLPGSPEGEVFAMAARGEHLIVAGDLEMNSNVACYDGEWLALGSVQQDIICLDIAEGVVVAGGRSFLGVYRGEDWLRLSDANGAIVTSVLIRRGEVLFGRSLLSANVPGPPRVSRPGSSSGTHAVAIPPADRLAVE